MTESEYLSAVNRAHIFSIHYHLREIMPEYTSEIDEKEYKDFLEWIYQLTQNMSLALKED